MQATAHCVRSFETHTRTNWGQKPTNRVHWLVTSKLLYNSTLDASFDRMDNTLGRLATAFLLREVCNMAGGHDRYCSYLDTRFHAARIVLNADRKMFPKRGSVQHLYFATQLTLQEQPSWLSKLRAATCCDDFPAARTNREVPEPKWPSNNAWKQTLC